MNIPMEVIETAQNLPIPSARCQFYGSVLEYLAYGEEPSFPMCVAASNLFTISKPVLDMYKAYLDGAEQS